MIQKNQYLLNNCKTSKSLKDVLSLKVGESHSKI